jgi:hypothetical protein
MDLALLNPNPLDPADPLLPGDTFIPPTFFDREERAVRVTIVEVNNIFTLSSSPGDEEEERYRGKDQHLYLKPHAAGGSSNPDFVDGAICIDGFLNIGDEAMYHSDEFELPDGKVILRYFTQGRPFGNGTIVQVQRVNADDPSTYDVTIVDPTTLDTLGEERAVFGVAVLNGSVAISDRTTLAVQGDAPVSPGPNNGTIFINGTAQESQAGVTPVEIVAVANQGLSTAIAQCRLLDYQGQVITSGTLYSNVIPIPYRQFAASGDRGFLATATVPSGNFGGTASVSFVEIVRPAYQKFRTI